MNDILKIINIDPFVTRNEIKRSINENIILNYLISIYHLFLKN